MNIFYNSQNLKTFLRENQTYDYGFVPTMGALHQGHLSLIQRASEENSWVVVSIFVNPTQFNNLEDLEKYPRTLERDVQLLELNFDRIVVYAPTVADLYPDGTLSKSFDFNHLDKVMEGKHRPGHFDGVGTVVESLIKNVEATKVYFGEKDYQQLKIIQHLNQQYHWGVQIIPCPISREPHGLARSSRNELLDKTIREEARIIYESLLYVRDSFGTKNAKELTTWVSSVFEDHQNFSLEYFTIADAEYLTPMKRIEPNTEYRAFIAVCAGKVRLIDNIAL